jgi:hypothetical protein
MWKNIFREFRLYIEIADNIESYNKWRKKCLKVWPIDEDQIQESIDLLEHGIDTETEEKTLHAEDLKQMWEEELERIDAEYEVQVRNVPGCFNIPEEQTVVVAKGRGDERLYSESEAKILTMHELFHVVRAYNGRKAGEKSGLPPFLGIRTPFYDRTEEGGAVYREIRTGVITSEKEFDYHLRAVAAYYVAEGLGFMEAAEKLVDLGGKPERAFELLARNREILRHHIYMAGVAEWKRTDNLDKLLVGKVNSEYAELFWKEVEAEGMLEKPPVTAEQVFDYGF